MTRKQSCVAREENVVEGHSGSGIDGSDAS